MAHLLNDKKEAGNSRSVAEDKIMTQKPLSHTQHTSIIDGIPDNEKGSECLKDYLTMISARFHPPSIRPSPDQRAVEVGLPSLDEKYLTRLREMTLSIWPRIRESSRTEQEYYQSLLSGEKANQDAKTADTFGKLSQMYGPLPSEKYQNRVKISKWIWTDAYRTSYEKFPGSDDNLLTQLTNAYVQTKIDLMQADIRNDKLPDTTPEPPKTQPISQSQDEESKAQAPQQPGPTTFGHSVYDEAFEDDYEDDDYEEEDDCDHDEIFDDHLTERYGRQGYGGWD